MFISKIIVNGFKSYSSNQELAEFSPEINIIIGNNGSGKSNLLAAIQFVLTDEYDNLRTEERMLLFHEGIGPKITTTSVEIVFNNGKRRLPFEADYVSIKRTLTLKSDQYFVENKLVKKQDITNILETAGISKANNYYIVKQGKITQLATAKDSGRLKMLQQIAGVQVYDEKKAQSETILNETQLKRQQIDTYIEEIEQRLKTLELEKCELLEYNELYTMRNSIEYSIYERELNDMSAKYDDLVKTISEYELKYKQLMDESENNDNYLKKIQKMHENSVEQSKKMEIELNYLKNERHHDLNQKILQMNLQLTSLKDNTCEVDVTNSEESNIREQISQLEQLLNNNILPTYNDLVEKEKSLKNEIQKNEALKLTQYIVNNKSSRFTTDEQRNDWLKKEIVKFKANKDEIQTQLNHHELHLRHTKENLQTLCSKLKNDENLNNNVSNNDQDLVESYNNEKAALISEQHQLIMQKNDACREELVKIELVNDLRNSYNKCLKNFQKSMPKSVCIGMDSLDKLTKKYNLKHYGYLIDNIQFEEEFNTVVQITAGKYLFNVIVDDDKIASQILTHFNQEKLPGEISFIPVNKLKPISNKFHYTDDMENDCVPLDSHIRFNNKFDGWENVLQLVFGNTLLCKNLEIASRYSKHYKVNGITLDGDRVTYKGTLMGGYVNKISSKISNYHSMVLSKEKLDYEENNLIELRSKIDKFENNLDLINIKIQKLCNAIQHIEQKRKLYEEKVSVYKDEISECKILIENKNDVISLLKEKIVQIDSIVENMNSELNHSHIDINHTENNQKVNKLISHINLLNTSLSNITKDRIKIEKKKFEVENKLNNDLYLKIQNLSLKKTSTTSNEYSIKNISKDLNLLLDRANQIDQKIYALSQKIKEENEITYKFSNEIEILNAKRRQNISEKNFLLQKLESLSSKKHHYNCQLKDMRNRLESIDPVEQSQIEKNQSQTLKELWKQLNHINGSLDRFSGLNKKAYEQYITFSKKKDLLVQRKKNLDDSYNAIIEMIDALEERKNNAIFKTFDQLSHEFSSIFTELIPNGYAKLSLIQKKDILSNKNDDDDSDDSHIFVNNDVTSCDEGCMLSGISIDVSFNVNDSNQLLKSSKINQLSGGQKTVVALALIFAMQKCDSAPFYIFDEIDQALDSQYRYGIAKIIQKLSVNSQFIITTFRTELIPYASCIYGVDFSGRVSHIRKLTQDQVENYVDEMTADVDR